MATSPYFLDRTIALVRRLADEPTINAKYDDNELLEHIEQSFQVVLADLNSAADHPMLGRLLLHLKAETYDYFLPPSVDSIIQIAEYDIETLRVLAQVFPRPGSSWGGPGIRIEGRVLRPEPFYRGADRWIVVTYVPNGDFRLHRGEGTATADADELILAAAPSSGILDTRENCYLGAVLRIVSDASGFIQERTIVEYDRETRLAEVAPDFDPVLAGTILYEITPTYGRLIEKLVAYDVAIDLVVIAGDEKRTRLLTGQRLRTLRSLRMTLSRAGGIGGDHFEHRTAFGELYPYR